MTNLHGLRAASVVVARRLLLSLPLLFIVTTMTFVLAAVIPGDLARTLIGAVGTEEQYQSLRHALGLDLPLHERYTDWLWHAVRGDLGTSAISQEPVTQLLNSRLGVTFSLVIGATLVATIVGVGLGVLGAVRRGAAGRFVDATAMLGLAIPDFLLGLALVAILAVKFQLFPATGYVPFSQSPSQWLQSLVLPVVTLALPASTVIAKQTRDAMSDTLGRPFIRTLRAAGVPQRSLIFKHALRTSGTTVITVVGLVFVAVLSGTVIIESVFAIPGLGGLAVQATTQHDVPLIQGVVLYFTMIVVGINLLVDLIHAWLDPRMRTA